MTFLKLNILLTGFLLISGSLWGQQSKAASGFVYHSVEKKETVFSIAKSHGVTPEEIYRYNPGSKEAIKTGQVLQIPQKQPTQPANQSKEILYKVSKGESLYFIAKKFNCSQEAILRLNPGLASAPVKKGMILKIPDPDYQQQEKDLKQNFILYKIQKGDTYFNLKKRFGVQKEELEKVNPELKEGLKEGLLIKIPEKNTHENTNTKDQEQKELTSSQPLIHRDKNRPFNIGLYLPFKSELNDSSGLSAQTANYLEFLEGAMLADGNLKSEGLNSKLYVYDTHQDPKVMEQLVKKPEFLSLDLIIGPVYPECQKIISELSGKNHIPMVSPLSPDNRYVSTNGYYYQVNLDRKLRQKATADYIIREFPGKTVLYLGLDNGNPELGKLKQYLNPADFHLYDLWSDERSGIENHLNPEKQNVVVLTDPDEARVSVAITRLNTVAKKYPILLVGLQEYTRMKSINTEYLHNLNLHYLSPYYVNYKDPDVQNFIEKFHTEFGAEPSQYAYQGFDVLTGFLKGLRNSGRELVPDTSGLLQVSWHFQRVSPFGGFQNTNFFILEYTGNYEVNCIGKLNLSF